GARAEEGRERGGPAGPAQGRRRPAARTAGGAAAPCPGAPPAGRQPEAGGGQGGQGQRRGMVDGVTTRNVGGAARTRRPSRVLPPVGQLIVVWPPSTTRACPALW